METIIRKAESEDIAYLLAHLPCITEELLKRPNYSEMKPPMQMFAIEATPFSMNEISVNSLSLIAEVDNYIAGIITCRGGRYDEIKHVSSLEVYVGKKWRNNGIGSDLLKNAINWAKENNQIKRLHVEFPSDNNQLVNFYKKLDFQIEATLRKSILINDMLKDNLIMSLLV